MASGGGKRVRLAEDTELIPEEEISSHSESSFQSGFNRSAPAKAATTFQRANTAIFINVVKLDNDMPVAPINEESDRSETVAERAYRMNILSDQVATKLLNSHVLKDTVSAAAMTLEARLSTDIANKALSRATNTLVTELVSSTL